MKKHLLLLAIVFGVGCANGQNYGDILSRFNDCGTWSQSLDTTYGWQNYDTISKFKIAKGHQWVEDRWRQIISNEVSAVWCPCGCPDPILYEQFRVDKVSGIRQKRQRIIYMTYTPAPKSDYQKAIDSIKTDK